MLSGIEPGECLAEASVLAAADGLDHRLADLLSGPAADFVELRLAGVDAALGGLAAGLGDSPAGRRQQLLLAPARRHQEAEQRADRQAADHRPDRVDRDLLGRLPGHVRGAVARRLVGRIGPLARRLIGIRRTAARRALARPGGPGIRARAVAFKLRNHHFTPSVTDASTIGADAANCGLSVSMRVTIRPSSGSISSLNRRLTVRFSGSRARKSATAPTATETAAGRLRTALSAPSARSALLSLTPSQASPARLPGRSLCWTATSVESSRARAITALRFACSTCSRLTAMSPRARLPFSPHRRRRARAGR